MKLTVKIFRNFFSMKLTVKIFRKFSAAEFNEKKFKTFLQSISLKQISKIFYC